MIKDLTVGPPGKALRNFSLPLLGGVIFQQMYNVADSLIAGKMIGEDALSAVGNAYEVTLIYLPSPSAATSAVRLILPSSTARKKSGS